MRAQARRLRKPLASVFVGGGTPTSIGAAGLDELLAIPADWLDSDTEFSVEANPCTVNGRGVEVLVSAGVNRVNLGVQSLRADELKALGRIHSPQQARDAFNMLRQAGLQNLGLDLIYGIPGQSLQSWQASVAEALDLRPQHLSCYALSFEENTPLRQDLQAGRVEEMDEAVQETCWRHAISAAAKAGLEHYEISNFAQPGRQCRHNLTYWHNMPYIGLGPGAASYFGGVRRMKQRPDEVQPALLHGSHVLTEVLWTRLRLDDPLPTPAAQRHIQPAIRTNTYHDHALARCGQTRAIRRRRRNRNLKASS